MTSSNTAVVVGAGLAGLTAAHRLARRGLAVTVIERQPQVGGPVQTVVKDGFLFESGPNSIRATSPAVTALIAELGLADRVITSQDAAKDRYIWRHGKAHRMGPRELFLGDLMSLRGRLRLLSEPFIPRTRPNPSASLSDFLTARLGHEAVSALVEPFVTGIFAGDPRLLGLDALPAVSTMAKAGGILRGVSRLRAERGPRPKGAPKSPAITTFDRGLHTLVEALAASIVAAGGQILTNTVVTSITRTESGFGVHLEAEGQGGALTHLATDHLVLAIAPALALRLAPDLLKAPDSGLGRQVSASAVTVGLGLRSADFPNDRIPSGFGLLVAPDSPVGPSGLLAGLVFASSVFAGRAPDGHLLITAIMGGIRKPDAVLRDDAALIDEAVSALGTLFGYRGTPVVTSVSRWPETIAQLGPGHHDQVADLRATLPAGLSLCGGGFFGPALPDVITSGFAAADAVLARVA